MVNGCMRRCTPSHSYREQRERATAASSHKLDCLNRPLYGQLGAETIAQGKHEFRILPVAQSFWPGRGSMWSLDVGQSDSRRDDSITRYYLVVPSAVVS
jgi:hypothetical protein